MNNDMEKQSTRPHLQLGSCGSPWELEAEVDVHNRSELDG